MFRKTAINIAASTALITVPFATQAQDDIAADFVAANILGIFYHELGHAIIDIEGVPIFAQEEDAADVFSIYLIDALYEAEAAEALAYDAAFGFLAEADNRNQFTDEIAWWDVHGPDEQRFYNTVCIFYGADPQARGAFARDLDLPEDRAEYCPDEFDQADHAWGAVLDEVTGRKSGDEIVFEARDDLMATEILREEIGYLNGEFRLSSRLQISVEPCGEANAFYDPQETRIIFCSEFEDHLWELAENM
ncbi:MAG: DUF4344 domain-containing metallopeptidase [Paracoccaceae bacterium]